MPRNGYHRLENLLGYLGMDIIDWKPFYKGIMPRNGYHRLETLLQGYNASEWIS